MSPPRRPRRQRGAAILVAMLILTLVATLAAGMVWLQWRGIEVESAERARAQGEWLLNGALDWARLILKSDARAGNTVDHLGEPWAMPLAESRLSTFLASDQNHSDDSGPDAFLSGQITDANARYNLYRLYAGAQQNGRLELQNFQALCAAIGLQAGVADMIYAGLGQSWTTAQNTDEASTEKDQSNSVLMPTRVSQLAWYGIDPAALKQLEPYVVMIPDANAKVNVNTASAEVLMAAIPGINRGGAQAIIQQRAQKPFTDVAEALTVANYQAPAQGNGQATPPAVDVKSDYFEVFGQLRYEQHVLRERTLVHRMGTMQVDVLRRERLAPDVQ